MNDWINDLRVLAFADGSVSITVRNNGDSLDCFGVRQPACDLAPAIKVLNDGIKGWPRYPVTVEQVRAFANV